MPDVPELPEALGYTLEVTGPVYQHDDQGVLRLIDGADLDPTRPFFMIPDEAAHEQGDEPAELGPGWVDLGAVSDGLDLEPQQRHVTVEELNVSLNAAEEWDRRRAVQLARYRPAPTPDAPADNQPYVRSGLGRAHIMRRQEVPPPTPFVLPEALGGLPEDAPEAERYRLNREDRRRLERRARRG